MPNAMDYDALAKMYASEQDPRQLTMNDALQNYSRQQKIEALIAEARSQQQLENQRNLQGDQLKNDYMRAQIAQMQSGAIRENGTQKANLMKEQALEKARRAAGILSGIKSSYDLPGMDSSPALDSFVNDKEIPEEAKRFLRPDPKTSNYTKQAIDAAISHLNGYDPLQMKQQGIETKAASSEKIATDRNLSNEKIARMRAQKSAESAKTNKVPPTESAQANYLYNLGMEAELAGDSAKAVNLYNRADAAYKQAEAKAAAAAKVAMGGKPDVGALAEGTLRKNVVPTQETPAAAAIRSIQGKIGGGQVTNKPSAGDF